MDTNQIQLARAIVAERLREAAAARQARSNRQPGFPAALERVEAAIGRLLRPTIANRTPAATTPNSGCAI